MGKAKPKPREAGSTATATATPPTPEAQTPALTPAQTSTEAQNAYRKAYKVMHIGIGAPTSERMKVYVALENLATSLTVKVSDVVWHAIYDLLDSPPTSLREDVITSVGIASGFWLIVDTDSTSGQATNTHTQEVEQRHLVRDGQTFFRYEPGDVKSRLRAERQALLAERQMRKLLGLPVKEIPTPAEQEQEEAQEEN